MITLTWRLAPEPKAVKKALEKLRRLWFERYGEGLDAWIMEMQIRGVPHFHLFVAEESAAGREIAQMPTQIMVRRKKPRRIVRGRFDAWLVQSWLEILDDDDEGTKAFQRGGICELFDSPSGAARYVAKEATKREQKLLPEQYSAGLGRWWYLARKWKPKAEDQGRIDGDVWEEIFGGPMKFVWDAEAIAGALLPPLPSPVSAGRPYALRTDRAMPLRPLRLPEGQTFLAGMRKRSDDKERHGD